MKNYKYFIIAISLTAIFGTTACNDDAFLTEKTETSYTYANAFDSPSQVNDCLTELYYAHKSIRLASTDFLAGMGTDLYDNRPNSTPIYSDFTNWNPTFDNIRNVWNDYYSLIAKANLVLLGAEKVTWANEDEKNYITAQARCIRGYCYLVLAEVYGGVPISAVFSESPKLDFTRASREDTYLFVISDLEAATAALPERQTPGRVGKGAAYHYLTEAYIALATLKNNDAAMLDKAIAAAGEVLKRHSLMKERFGVRANPSSTSTNNDIPAYFPDGDVYFDLFQRGNLDYEEGNTESLWVAQNSAAAAETYDGFSTPMKGVHFGARVAAQWLPKWIEPNSGASPFRGADVPNTKWGYPGYMLAYTGGNGLGTMLPTIFCKNTVWKDCGNDVRNSAVNIRRTFPVLAQNHSLYGKYIHCDSLEYYLAESYLWYVWPVSTKFAPYDDWGWERLSKQQYREIYSDVYILRASETYLLRAEAKLRKGDKAGAAADINEVRARAKAPLITAADATLDYILDERARELYGEEQRWCTLLRMGGTIPNDRITRYSYACAERQPKWNGTLAPDFLFPIPQQAIDSNLGAEIEQNPMWK